MRSCRARTLPALALAAVVAAVVVAFTWSTSASATASATAPAPGERRPEPVYKLGVGNLRVDLSNLDPARPCHAKVGIGELRIVVPPGTCRDGPRKVGTSAFGQHDAATTRAARPSSGKLVVDATVGAGRIDIVRAVR